jgi:phosphoribosylglycinamide formyltransferase-1
VATASAAQATAVHLRIGATLTSLDVRVAVLVSGTGTGLDSLVDASVPVALVAADRPCEALERASRAGVEPLLVARTSFGKDFDRLAYTASMVAELRERHIDLIAMAGFGTIFTSEIHDAYGGRILNTHPSLLPAFPGWHAVRDALAYGVKVTGCTVHVAGIEVDTGPILAQEPVRVRDDDTEESLHHRIKAVEHKLYPDTIRSILERGSVL